MKTRMIGVLLLMMAPSLDLVRADSEPIRILVMDPLSAKLSCDCVKGYAQRKYERLAAHIEKMLGRPVQMVWTESLAKAKTELKDIPPDLVIGKHSVILTDAKEEGWDAIPIASLTGKDGKTTQTGLIVVRKDDIALTTADLYGYRIFFGPADCDEKSMAIKTLLRVSGIDVPENPEIASSCSEAVKKLVALPADEKAAAVISSYAEPLLAGCGTVKKGDLRIIGVSEEVPFITAFARASLPADQRSALSSALLNVNQNPDLIRALESKSGFVSFVPMTSVASTKKK